MNTQVKQRSIMTVLLSALCVVISAMIAMAVFAAPRGAALADETEDNAHGYYYSQLRNSKLAERLYDALLDMNTKGYFEKCIDQYDLTTVLTQPELGDYIVNKSPAIPVALGAARDAFYLDHPELFYVSVHNMRFTFGSDGTNHKAYLGAGKADNYYAEYTATSAEEVKAAVADFNTQVEKVVTAAKAKVGVVEQIKYVNEYLCDNAKYDFGAYDDAHSDRPYNGYVYTAYGILNGGEGKALCEGYAKAFKVIMDKLNIPCVLIAGAACNGIDGKDSEGHTFESTYEPHMWNAVRVDGQWYGVDVTWNDTENKHDKYTLVGELSLMKNRYDNPVISSSEFKVRYPVLRTLDYGDFVDDGGFEFKDSGMVAGQELGYDSGLVGVSYEDKNINQLKADGKYLAIRLGDDQPWTAYSSWIDFMAPNMDGELIAGKYTLFMPHMAEESSQFAIIDVAPDSQTEVGGMSAGTWTNLAPEHILAVSAKYNNQDFGTGPSMPFIKSMTPNEKGYIMSYEPTDISITYHEKLIYADAVSKEVGIEVTAERSDIKPTVKNVVWHEDTNTVTFTFTPSSPYAHNSLTYNFVPTNLIGAESGERPEAGRLAFKRDEVICPKVFNDGRLYMKIYGTPQFVSASDESLNEFKDKNGQPIVNQRSQLMLVINQPTKAENEQMHEKAKDLGDTVLASSTYQINLQMCGMIQKVPDGSYMQVGFGFPEGMSHEDEDISFTVYHYTRNEDGTIKSVEAVPCVVTQYGVIATVKSFSPFMICAVTADSPSVQNVGKRVLASVDGVGGNIDKNDIESVATGGSITYTITKETGYEIDHVFVNGVDKKASVTADGKLTLNESELNANNTVVVSFISDRAAKFIADNNLKVVEHNLLVTERDMIIAYVAEDVTTPTEPEDSNTGIIIALVVVIIVLVAAVGVLLFLLLRKNGQQKNPPAKKETNEKPEQKKAPEQAAKQTEAAPARPTASLQSASGVTAARPTVSAQKPNTATAQRPIASAQKPSGTSTQRPAVAAQRPSSVATARPATQRPTVAPASRTQNSTTQRQTTTSARPQSGAVRSVPTDKGKNK